MQTIVILSSAWIPAQLFGALVYVPIAEDLFFPDVSFTRFTFACLHSDYSSTSHFARRSRFDRIRIRYVPSTFNSCFPERKHNICSENNIRGKIELFMRRQHGPRIQRSSEAEADFLFSAVADSERQLPFARRPSYREDFHDLTTGRVSRSVPVDGTARSSIPETVNKPLAQTKSLVLDASGRISSD
ncbi:hypothetical protein DFH07DRAFT_505760 [Mycena maculata]|uniref:Uncharacterized protein n=1 Tax=Mycena maculata TaxID=230809 RepID=A0AAD7J1N4_9AGAR|nr:hypothetical protein DFH07DRAFT_505760 [Mycena maculata]